MKRNSNEFIRTTDGTYTVPLTPMETEQKQRQLVDAILRLKKAEEDKREMMKTLREGIQAIKDEVDDISTALHEGQEHRRIEGVQVLVNTLTWRATHTHPTTGDVLRDEILDESQRERFRQTDLVQDSGVAG